jgi:hypothetical protein
MDFSSLWTAMPFFIAGACGGCYIGWRAGKRDRQR